MLLHTENKVMFRILLSAGYCSAYMKLERKYFHLVLGFCYLLFHAFCSFKATLTIDNKAYGSAMLFCFVSWGIVLCIVALNSVWTF